jgi:hypothetical protein
MPAPNLLGSHQAAGGTSAVTDARAQRVCMRLHLKVRLQTYRLRGVVQIALILTSVDI